MVLIVMKVVTRVSLHQVVLIVIVWWRGRLLLLVDLFVRSLYLLSFDLAEKVDLPILIRVLRQHTFTIVTEVLVDIGAIREVHCLVLDLGAQRRRVVGAILINLLQETLIEVTPPLLALKHRHIGCILDLAKIDFLNPVRLFDRVLVPIHEVRLGRWHHHIAHLPVLVLLVALALALTLDLEHGS